MDALTAQHVDERLAPLLRSAQTIRRRRLLNEAFLQRLRQQLHAPMTEVPKFFTPAIDRVVLDQIGRRLLA